MHACRLFGCVLAAAAVLALTGCGGSETDDPGSWIVGQWTLDGVSQTIDGPRQNPQDLGVSLNADVADDGTWTGTGSAPGTAPEQREGTWRYLGGGRWLLIHDPEMMPVSRRGNELHMSGDYEAMEGHLWFSRVVN